MLTDHEKTNFSTLKRAANFDDLAILETHRISDGKRVVLLCAVSPPGGKRNTYDISPFAEMIDGNPYELYEPPFSGDEVGETSKKEDDSPDGVVDLT